MPAAPSTLLAPIVHRLGGALATSRVQLLPTAPPAPSDLDGCTTAHKLLMLSQWDSDLHAHLFSIADLAVTSRSGALPTTQLDVVTQWRSPAQIVDMQVSELTGQEVLLALAMHNGSLLLSRFLVPRAPGSTPAQVDILVLPQGEEGEGLQPQLEGLHKGSISSVDVQASSKAVLTVGGDGAINIVDAEMGLQGEQQGVTTFKRRKHGCSAFTCGRWTGTSTFLTASALGGLEAWDTRMGPVSTSHSPAQWGPVGAGDVGGARDQLQVSFSGPPQVHALAVHPSRPDLVACGATGGVVCVWDLRWTAKPLITSLPGGAMDDVWDVRFDPMQQQQTTDGAPGVLFSTQGGCLGQSVGLTSAALASSHHAVTSFDVDAQGCDLVAVTGGNEVIYVRRG